MPTAWSSSCGGRDSARSRSACIEHQWHDWPELRQIGAARRRACCSSRAAPRRRASKCRRARWSRRSRRPLRPRSKRAASAWPLRRTAACASSRRPSVDSAAVPDGAEVFYPTSDVGLAPARASGRGGDAGAATCACTPRRCIRRWRPTISRRNWPRCAHRSAGAAAARVTRSGVRRPSRTSRAARGFELPPGPGGADRRLDDALLARDRAARMAARLPDTMPTRRSSGRCDSSSAMPRPRGGS